MYIERTVSDSHFIIATTRFTLENSRAKLTNNLLIKSRPVFLDIVGTENQHKAYTKSVTAEHVSMKRGAHSRQIRPSASSASI